MEQKYAESQRVRIIPLIDGFGRHDPRVKELIGKAGAVVKAYWVSGDEVWEKTLEFIDGYCYDIRLDDGEMARGIPEVGLESEIPKRR